MPAQPEDLTDQPATPADGASSDQLVREGLRCLQFSGALFLRASFSAPWAYRSAEARAISEMVRSAGRRVIMFHIFTEGQCRVQLDRGGIHELRAGDIAIFPDSDNHSMGDPAIERPVPAIDLMPPQPWGPVSVIRHGGGGAPSSMICGYLLCDDLPLHPVLASLPPFMRVRPSGGPLAKWVEASIHYAIHAAESREPVGDPLMQRLPELLFTECLCEFVRQQPADETGWLAALRDAVVGRALASMHREPAYAWTLQELAKRAAASRSVMDDRFREYLGMAPMSYLTSWRLQLAARQLRTSDATLAEVAGAVGYGSEASFSRAFKRHVGVAPGEWRRA
ncbi:MAG TPA: AraC family transcriptional regulator [Polyangia bacterium]|jgi:AraC-like DNA-binding protein|nr:AraC family transcriptional regulator [Polyangia bacterium]